MPRVARFVIPECFYHITQRGNNRQSVFIDDTDRRRYLFWIEEYKTKFGVEIFAYCLMNNHVHFIARPLEKEAFAALFHAVHSRYAQYFNKRYKASGHLWQGRYYSHLLDEKHFPSAVRYIERNPLRAKMVLKAWEWPWSSAPEHIGKGKGIIQLSDIKKYMEIKNWMTYIDDMDGDRPLFLS